MEDCRSDLDQLIVRAQESTCRAAEVKEPDRARAFATELIDQVLDYAGHDFGLQKTPLIAICRLFGIALRLGRIDGAEALFLVDRNEIVVSEKEVIPTDGKPRLSRRGRFSVGHEFSHFLLHKVAERFPEIASEYRLALPDHYCRSIESLCNHMSGELIAPKRTFELPIGKPDQDLPNICSPHLTVSMLEAIAETLDASRFVVVQQMNNTRALEDLESAVLISLFAANSNTGRSPGLRVCYRALPRWGYIPANVKLSNIGLQSAIYALEEPGRGMVKEWDGDLVVKERRRLQDETWDTWHTRTLKTSGEHAVFQFGTQRYLMTIVAWPRP